MPEFTLEEPKGENTEFSPIPDGSVLEAEVIGIETKKKKIRGEEMDRVEFSFKIVDGEFTNRRVWGNTSTSFVDHPECKLRAWTQELMGVDLPKGFKLDTDTLIGARCRVAVNAYEYEPRDKPGTTKTSNSVFDVIRSKAGPATYNDPF